MANNCCKCLRNRKALQFGCFVAAVIICAFVLTDKSRFGTSNDGKDRDGGDYAVDSFLKSDFSYFNKEILPVLKETSALKEAMGNHRIVHLDLKGAVPKVSYLSQLFPFIKKLGATGLLIEYEDAFPFISADVSSLNGYSKHDIEEILKLANQSQLVVIPLVQTLGHLEFVLKLESYKSLREAERYPQAICPSKNESRKLLHHMIDEIVLVHKGIQYLHIGCDEVYQLALCNDCRSRMMAASWGPQELFLDHVSTIASYVKQKYPSVAVLIWDDELRRIPLELLSEWNLGKLIEPVVWKYTEDVETELNEGLWRKYEKLFPRLWFATAFKGAQSPDAITNSISLYLDNHRSWMGLISKYSSRIKFVGAFLTGWQRYDHFAVLCELLPVSIPSLAVNLLYLSSESKNDLVEVTSEAQTLCRCDSNPVLTLNNYVVRCVFPGSRLFLAISHLHHVFEQISTLKNGNTFKGWFTLYNRNHSFSSPSHIEEATNELLNLYSDVVSLERDIEEAMEPIYKPETFAEWSTTYIYPVKEDLKSIVQARERLLATESWPKRPLG